MVEVTPEHIQYKCIVIVCSDLPAQAYPISWGEEDSETYPPFGSQMCWGNEGHLYFDYIMCV